MGKRVKNEIWNLSKEQVEQACLVGKNLYEILRNLKLKPNPGNSKSLKKRIKKENILTPVLRKGKSWRFNPDSPKHKRIKSKNFKEIDGLFECYVCKKRYSKKGIGTHFYLNHGDGIGKNYFLLNKKPKGSISWNKGLTKSVDSRVKKGGETLKTRIKNGDVTPVQKGKPLSDTQKQKLSKSMKKAHSEKRAWNIGKSRWNNEPSYPEKFFKKVIENEFLDKKYETEYSLDIYSLDFAWVHKKKCIEIDGDQHYRFQENIQRDKRKDKAIEDSGWTILRIPWKEMYKDPKKWIQMAKEFIGL